MYAQKKEQLTGKLTDSTGTNPIHSATITLFDLNDTTVLNFSLTDRNGVFRFTGLPQDKSLMLVVTATGYQEWRIVWPASGEIPADLGRIQLRHVVKELGEVIVTSSRIPIVIRNDTIEFNANAFKTLPSAMLEDLLRKLPGVELGSNGSLTVNGKTVNRITLEGKQFFGNDLALALKNLPASMIDKVQVSEDKRERARNPDKPKSQMGQVMNLRFKKELKKGRFGNIQAGAGTRDLFTIGGNINVLRDTLQLSLIGESGNTRGNSTDIGSAGFGITTNSRLGTSITTVAGKTDLSFGYDFASRRSRTAEKSLTKQFISDSIFDISNADNGRSQDLRHAFTGGMKFQPGKKSFIEYRPAISFDRYRQQSSNSTFTNKNNLPVNGGESAITNRGTGFQTTHELSYEQHFAKEDQDLWASLVFYATKRDDSTINSSSNVFYNTGSATTLAQRRDQDYNDRRAELDLSYAEPLGRHWKYSVDVKARSAYGKDYIDTREFDPATGQYSVPSEEFSNGLTSTEFSSSTIGRIVYKSGKLTIAPGATFRSFNQKNQSLKNPEVTQDLYFILPTIKIEWDELQLTYRVSVQEPSLTDLQPTLNNTNPLFITLGNPALRPTRMHMFALDKNKYHESKRIMFSYNVRIFRNTAQILRSRTIDGNGVQTSMPVNIDGRWNVVGTGYIRKEFVKLNERKLALTASLSTQFLSTPFLLNGITGFANATNLTPGAQFSLESGNKLSFQQHYQFMWSHTRYRDELYPQLFVRRHISMTHISYSLSKDLRWESTLNWSYNPQTAPGFRKSAAQLNCALAWQFLKDKHAQLALSVNDLLNQNVAFRRTVAENYTRDTEYLILRRYVLLSFRYSFRNMGNTSRN
ncbi:MAG: TonB-dependent receptor [Chitinophagaceae bacterium]|nr:MAG: TonB-dependent receptor [Chitinophagaceae bacterium]